MVFLLQCWWPLPFWGVWLFQCVSLAQVLYDELPQAVPSLWALYLGLAPDLSSLRAIQSRNANALFETLRC